MLSTKHIKYSGIILILLISISCSISLANSEKGDDIENMKLELTRQALQLTQVALSNSDSNQEQSQSSSDNQSNDSQTTESQTSETKEEENEIPCNDSHIIGETIKDGTVFDPGKAFEKTWTLRNDGDCDWTTSYKLKFVEGSRMDGASSISVPSVIEPNEDITFKINLTAPDDPGDYTGVWQLFADDGEEMGRYWVKITVEDPTPPFAVTSVSSNIANATYSGPCPHVIDVDIYIKANGPGTITYQAETSDLGLHPQGTITFNSAGTKTVSNTWTIQNPDNYWLKMHIKDPNNQIFGPYNTTVTCP